MKEKVFENNENRKSPSNSNKKISIITISLDILKPESEKTSFKSETLVNFNTYNNPK